MRNRTLAVLADELLDNIEIDKSTVLPLPEGANGIDNTLLNGVVETNNGSYYIINLEQVADSWLAASDHAGTVI